MTGLEIMHYASVTISGLLMIAIAVLIATHDPDRIAQSLRDRKVREQNTNDTEN